MDEIVSLLKNLTNTQVAVIMVGVVVLYLMRSGASIDVSGWLSNLWAKVKPTPVPAVDGTPDANAVAAAYKTLADYITDDDIREAVRHQLAQNFFGSLDKPKTEA